MRIAMAQINAIVGDLEGNTRKICEAIEAAAEKGADLIAFPELALTGYPPEDLLLKPDFVAANREALLEVARRTPAVSVVVGFVDADDHLYNAAALLYDGRIAGIYHKHRLPNYGGFDEKRYFQPGAECPLFALDTAPIAVTVCEDVWAPGGPPQAAARAGALLLININASPYHAGKWRQREEMLRTRARDYAATIAYVNLVGGQDELVFDGMSLVVDHLGTVVARGPQFQEGLVYCDVDLEAVQQARPPPAARAAAGAAGGDLPGAGAGHAGLRAQEPLPRRRGRPLRRHRLRPGERDRRGRPGPGTCARPARVFHRPALPRFQGGAAAYVSREAGRRDRREHPGTHPRDPADGALQQIRLAPAPNPKQERDERGARLATLWP